VIEFWGLKTSNLVEEEAVEGSALIGMVRKSVGETLDP